MGIVPAAGLAQGIDPPGVAEVPVGTVPARGIDRAGAVLWVPGTGRLGGAGVPAGTVRVRGTGRAGAVLWVPGTGRAEAAGVPAGTVRVRGTGRPWAGRGTGPVGIGRLGSEPSCGCS